MERYDSEQAVAELRSQLGAKVYEHDAQVQEHLCAMEEHIGKLQARLISSGAHVKATTSGDDKANGPWQSSGSPSHFKQVSQSYTGNGMNAACMYSNDS